MANDLAVRSDVNLDELQRTATMLVASGYFDAKGDRNTQIAQLATKIMAGRELGYGPFASVQGIHVIQGKPQVSANLMAAAVKSHPRYSYKVRKMDPDAVAIEFFENGESIGTSTFTADDAKRAGTQNMNKFPRNMLFARALSNGVRWYCPDVFHGQSVYVEGELDDTSNDTPAVVVVDRETGEIVEGEYSDVTPVTPNGKRNPVADMPERMAPSELPHSRLEPHESLGNGHKPTEAPADDVALISKVQLKALHAAGNDLYGAEWDWKRMSLVESITKGEFSSASDLTAAQADKLIQGMRDRIAKRNHDAEHSDEQSADNPFTETPEPVTA